MVVIVEVVDVDVCLSGSRLVVDSSVEVDAVEVKVGEVVVYGEVTDTDGVREKGVEERSTINRQGVRINSIYVPLCHYIWLSCLVVVPSYLAAVLWWWVKV